MKIDLNLPGGASLHLERQPMAPDRFQALCLVLGCLGGGALFVLLLVSVA